jgi:signal peptidase I
MSRMNIRSVASSALTVAVAAVCMVFVMRPTIVSGASMMPSLHDRDLLIASPLAKRMFEPARGDIVTVCLSANPLCGFAFSGDTQYVKRVVALPGDVVRYGSCNIFVTTATGRQVEDIEPTMACPTAATSRRSCSPPGCISSPATIAATVSIRACSVRSADRKSMPRCWPSCA